MLIRRLLLAVLAGIGFFALIQLVPYGRDHTNPPVRAEIKWDSQQTKDLAVRACYDCHSNETVWPWYSNIAPFSWLIQHDVEEGRGTLNFSEWDNPQRHINSAAQQIANGKMPRFYYLPLHPSANLSQAEKDALIRGLTATLAQQ